MTLLDRIVKIHHSLKLIGLYTSGVATIFMMLIIVADVFLRNVFNSPISGTYEIVQYYLMPFAIFPALAYTYSSGILPRLGELMEKAPQLLQNVATYMIVVIEMIIFALLAIYGGEFAKVAWQEKMSIPVSGNLLMHYPVYLLVPLGFGLLFFEVILSTILKMVKRGNLQI